MARLTLAVEDQGDKYTTEARMWFYGEMGDGDSTPSSLFGGSSSLYIIAEFLANKDGLTLYTARS